MAYRRVQSGPRVSDWSNAGHNTSLTGFRLAQIPALGWLLFLAAYCFVSLVLILAPLP